MVSFEDKRRWVSKTAIKRYAYPTKKKALQSFKARKQRQIQILKGKLFGAEIELELIEEVITGE